MDNQPKELDSTITFYRNKVGYNEGKESVYVYTESKEDWIKFSDELKDLVLYQALKAFMVGILIGLFTGFFTARADEATVKQLILQESSTVEQASALTSIAFIESSFRPNVRGKANEFGLFQFHPKFFKLHDKSIKGQIRFAINHYNRLLTNGCKKDSIALCWNLGIGGSRKIKNPKEFGYNIKFKWLKAKYEKEIVKNNRAYASNERQIPDFQNVDKAPRKGQIKGITWVVARKREYNIPGL